MNKIFPHVPKCSVQWWRAGIALRHHHHCKISRRRRLHYDRNFKNVSINYEDFFHLNTQNMTNPTIVSLSKLEYGWNFSISGLKMMVKIGVIFMPFSNPTYHFRGTADFTDCTDCTAGKVSCTSEMASRIWKWHENDTYFHHHI